MNINIHWLRNIPGRRLANVEIRDGYGSFIDLGALDGDELCALAQHLRKVADELGDNND